MQNAIVFIFNSNTKCYVQSTFYKPLNRIHIIYFNILEIIKDDKI